MHAISTVALLTTLAAGVLAQGIGSFDTFTDRACDEGGHGITVPDENAHGTLPREVLSVKSYLPGCSLVIWDQGGVWYPTVTRPGNSSCVDFIGSGRNWNIVCH